MWFELWIKLWTCSNSFQFARNQMYLLHSYFFYQKYYRTFFFSSICRMYTHDRWYANSTQKAFFSGNKTSFSIPRQAWNYCCGILQNTKRIMPYGKTKHYYIKQSCIYAVLFSRHLSTPLQRQNNEVTDDIKIFVYVYKRSKGSAKGYNWVYNTKF